MADNSHLFKGKRKTSPYKKEDVHTIATTYTKGEEHQAVVLLKQQSGLYTPLLLEVYPTRVQALQRAHYINANFILRNNEHDLPVHLLASDDGLAGLREKGYRV